MYTNIIHYIHFCEYINILCVLVKISPNKLLDNMVP